MIFVFFCLLLYLYYPEEHLAEIKYSINMC